VRKSSDYAQDVAKINPIHVVVAGILAGVLFVIGLVLLVRWVVASGAAQ
jgi:preprotein translocase subunit Sec61beta